MSEPRFVYVTEHALTRGIERRVEVKEDELGVVVVDAAYGNRRRRVRHKDVYQSEAGAQARVREMVAARLKSLDKERAKLERLARDGANVVEVKGE